MLKPQITKSQYQINFKYLKIKFLVITDLGERPRSHALRGDANRTLCVRLSSQHVVKTEYYHSLEIGSPYFDK